MTCPCSTHNMQLWGVEQTAEDLNWEVYQEWKPAEFLQSGKLQSTSCSIKVLTWVDAPYLLLFFYHCDFCSGHPWNWTIPHQRYGRKYRPCHCCHSLLAAPALHTDHTARASQDLTTLHRQSLFLWTRRGNRVKTVHDNLELQGSILWISPPAWTPIH